MSLANSLATLKQILNALPSATKPSLIRGTAQKWRDDFNGTSLSSDWEVAIGAGQSINVSNSELRINAAVTPNSQSVFKYKKPVNIPCRAHFICALSQRIVNQEFYLELVDNSGLHYARWILNGTSGTFGTIQTASGGNVSISANVSINNSAGYNILEIELVPEESKFFYRSIDSPNSRAGNITRTRRIPDPNLDYFIQIRVINLATAPTSNTILYLESIFLEATETLTAQVSGGRGSTGANEALAITPSAGSAFTVTGSITASIVDTPIYVTEILTPLAANSAFQGANRDSSGRSNLIVTVQTNQSGTLYIDQSQNNIDFLDYGGKACSSGINTFAVKLGLRYYRIRYLNGTIAPTVFRIYTSNYVVT